MEIKEVRQKLFEIERAMKTALNEFEKETGCYVDALYFERRPGTIAESGHPPISKVHVEAHVH